MSETATLEEILKNPVEIKLGDASEVAVANGATKPSPKPCSPIPRTSRWAGNYYGSNQCYLQPDHMTREERFPLIMDSAKKLKPDARRILSFGCSTGEECQSLAKRFPDAEIIGLDIDNPTIQTARRKNKSDKIFFHDEIGGTGTYDLCTALMVFFCMEEAVPRNRVVENLKKIDKHLNPGAVLMIYTSDHDPTDILGDTYEPLSVWLREHNKNGRQYYNGYYRKRGGAIVAPTSEVLETVVEPSVPSEKVDTIESSVEKIVDAVESEKIVEPSEQLSRFLHMPE